MESCPHGSAQKLRKHGLARNGKQRYFCPGLPAHEPFGTNAYGEARKAEVLCAYQKRALLHGLTRIPGVSRQTVKAWLKKPNSPTVEPEAGAAPAH